MTNEQIVQQHQEQHAGAPDVDECFICAADDTGVDGVQLVALYAELVRTERAIQQLESALSSQGVAMQRQLIHRADDIKRTIQRMSVAA